MIAWKDDWIEVVPLPNKMCVVVVGSNDCIHWEYTLLLIVSIGERCIMHSTLMMIDDDDDLVPLLVPQSPPLVVVEVVGMDGQKALHEVT